MIYVGTQNIRQQKTWIMKQNKQNKTKCPNTILIRNNPSSQELKTSYKAHKQHHTTALSKQHMIGHVQLQKFCVENSKYSMQYFLLEMF